MFSNIKQKNKKKNKTNRKKSEKQYKGQNNREYFFAIKPLISMETSTKYTFQFSGQIQVSQLPEMETGKKRHKQKTKIRSSSSS